MVDRADGTSPTQGASGAVGLQTSPAEAGEGGGDEVVPMRAHWSTASGREAARW
jgi:hypothetical protein